MQFLKTVEKEQHSLEKNLKIDILNYFLSIIIPGAINFFSIPIIKRLIGTESYGVYALWYGAFLVIVAATAGWLGISIIRFKADFKDQDFFYKHLFRIVSRLAASCAVISFISVAYISSNILFALVFSLAIVGCILQNSIMSISQANFHSRSIVYSESLRLLTFLLTYLALLYTDKTYFLEKLFFALILSYSVSFFYLKNKNNFSGVKLFSNEISSETFPYKSFFKFGIPLVLWYLFSSIIPYSDKILVARKFGFSVQGNYQAIFDLMYRTVAVVFSPVLIATFPYLSKFYSEGNMAKVTSIIKKTVLAEALIMMVCLIVYYLGAGRLVLDLLNIKDLDYLPVGALILAVAFTWQMAMMLHKPFELMKKTGILLLNNFLALIATMLPLMLIFFSNLSFIAYPTGILCGAITYALLCIYQVKRYLRKGAIHVEQEVATV